jgi:hypothetical protein
MSSGDQLLLDSATDADLQRRVTADSATGDGAGQRRYLEAAAGRGDEGVRD